MRSIPVIRCLWCIPILAMLIMATVMAAESKGPNVVIFFTDDQGTLDANCYGAKDLYTPNMDKLAAEGVRFTRAYAHKVCCPSRAMLLTGRYPQRSGVNSFTQANPKVRQGPNMAREEITLAEVLREAGYKTALFGKWHLGADFDHGPTEQGFDEYFGIRGGYIENYVHYAFKKDAFHDLYEGKKEVFAKGKYFPDLMTERAVQFIERNKERPFFLYVAYNIPHYPEQPDKKFDERYKDMKMPRRSYAKMISTTDDRMGVVMDAIEKQGLKDNTIILFMSDNGHSTENHKKKGGYNIDGIPKDAYLSAYGGGGFTGRWRGNKSTFYEGGLRVPAIISYPKKLPSGEVRDQAITAMDWMPTLLDLCGVEPPEVAFDGKNIMPIITSKSPPSPYTAIHWQWNVGWAVLQGDWKLIKDRGRLSLVNLAERNPEMKNHLKKKPEIVRTLQALHDDWLKDVMPNQ